MNIDHMRHAIDLASKGMGWTLPNPMVGAVIVKNNKIISEGYHEKFGGHHAEVNAIKNTNEDLQNAELYVTLEPCCHFGKTPPCTEAIISSGIKKVYICSVDPSEKVAGKGVEELKKAGIHVQSGILENEAITLNEQFFTFHTKQRPYVTLKVAMSLDAKISVNNKTRTRLSGNDSQIQTHKLRHTHQAVLVGAGTAITDNPNLGTSLIGGREPIRVIMKGKRELSPDLDIFRNENYLVFENMSFKDVLNELYKENIISVLIEGGAKIYEDAFSSGLIDKVHFFYSPQIIGENGYPFLKLQSKISFSDISVQKLGCDTHISATPKWDSDNT